MPQTIVRSLSKFELYFPGGELAKKFLFFDSYCFVGTVFGGSIRGLMFFLEQNKEKKHKGEQEERRSRREEETDKEQ